MQFTLSCQQSDLLLALSYLSKGVAPVSPVPILEMLRLEVKGGNTLILTSSDLGVIVKYRVTCSADADGAICVPAAPLTNFVKLITKGDAKVEFKADGDRVEVKCGRSKAKLTGTKAEDFPKSPVERDGANKVGMFESSTLVSALKFTSRFLSKDDLRPVMTGVSVEYKSGADATFAGTDAHRMGVVDVPFDGNEYVSIWPAKAVSIITMFGSGEVTLHEKDGFAVLSWGDVILIFRVIDGNFPNWRVVVPQDNPIEGKVGLNALQGALKRSLTLANAVSPIVKFSKVNTDEVHEVLIQAEDIDLGRSSEDSIPCEGDDNSIEIGFNGKYLLDIASAFEGDGLRFEMSTPMRAGIFKGDSDDRFALLMPTRFDE